MNTMTINDLTLSNDLDRQVMSALTGGGSATIYTGTSYSGFNTSFSHSTKQLQAFGWYQGKWAAWLQLQEALQADANQDQALPEDRLELSASRFG